MAIFSCCGGDRLRFPHARRQPPIERAERRVRPAGAEFRPPETQQRCGAIAGAPRSSTTAPSRRKSYCAARDSSHMRVKSRFACPWPCREAGAAFPNKLQRQIWPNPIDLAQVHTEDGMGAVPRARRRLERSPDGLFPGRVGACARVVVPPPSAVSGSLRSVCRRPSLSSGRCRIIPGPGSGAKTCSSR